MRFDIKQYINNISPEKFEELCVEYLRYLKGNAFRIKGTRYCKDGGKDIVGIADNEIPYEIWAECKKHSRSIGLNEISKNVVLVLSENINELIFFSTSNITAGAQKHISNLAARHNFAVAYYYGDKLISALAELPLFRKTKKTQIEESSNAHSLVTQLKLSQYVNSDFYEPDTKIILHRDTVFYMDIFFTNNSAEIIRNIELELPSSNSMVFHLQPYNKHFNLSPHCDRIIQIKVNVINCIRKCRITKIIIKYEYGGEKHSSYLPTVTVDPTQLTYFPLIGVKLNDFLKLTAEPIFRATTHNTYIIDIRGGSGVGKSRLIKEMLLIGESHNWHIKQYDGNNTKDLNIIKDLLCSFIGLPFYSGNINFSASEIKKILKSQGDDEEFAEVLYDFIYGNKTSDEILYYIEDALLYWLKHPYLDYPYVFAIDNFQEMDISILDILNHLISMMNKISAKFIIVLGTNIERIPKKTQEQLEEFLRTLDSYDDDYRLFRNILPLDYMEAKTFYVGLLKNIEDHELLLNLLINKAGTRPFDMIMQLKYMQEQHIISWQDGNSWYIQNFEGFDTFVNEVPSKSNALIRQRVQHQLALSDEFASETYYQKCFKAVIKSLLLFKDNLPIAFVYFQNIEEELFIELMDSLFFKYDEKEPEIHFYHNNLYLYFSKQKIYLYDLEVIKHAVSWLENNIEYPIKNREVILLDCYIRLGKYETAKDKGLECLKSTFNIYNFADTVSIAELLLSIQQLNLREDEVFQIKLLMADAYHEKIDHEKGAEIYNELCDIVNQQSILQTEEEVDRFYHKAINANLNSNHPDIALDILKKFSTLEITIPFYKLILYDRFAVVYLALGMVDDAESSIKKAIDIAKSAENAQWLGIVYSDYAYLHYRGFGDSLKAQNYFIKAFDIQFPKLKSQNRRGELLQQKAFAELLKTNYEQALSDVDMSIQICEKIHCTYLQVKAVNLKGIILIYMNRYQEAIRLWSQGIDICQKIKNLPGKIRLYCNIGAYYLAKNNIQYAKDNLHISYQLFLDNHFSDVHYKELFYNLLRLYTITGDKGSIEEILKNTSAIHIEEFYNLLTEQDGNNTFEYGILYYKNCNFIF